ncbi:MAG: DUF1801 domain-containing protein [Gemmatimonadetes bacterium]|nr:DUF1801 domain-containing protein [Gemmatimonadota bacterium]NNF14495.1 DUF1801 domain-containing protein [Gemmatimonadota bacterium]NNL29609.1 DUF1801 domain-containing protein [Gemmatimonadota bacterium]
MKSEADTVQAYLDELPGDRRQALEKVRATILDNLPEGYEEVMNWGMIAYQVPMEVYPQTYNKQPLMYAALASQKNHMAVYLSGIYADDEARGDFEKAYRATGKRLDVGKSCVRFKRLDDLPLEVIGEAVAAHSIDDFVKTYEAGRARARSRTKGN